MVKSMTENDQTLDDQPKEDEDITLEGEDEENIMKKLNEQQRELQEQMKIIDRDLRVLRRKKRRKTRYTDTENDFNEKERPGFGVRFERMSDDLGDTIETYVGNILDSVAYGLEGALDGLFGHRADSRKIKSSRRTKIRHKFGGYRYKLSDEEREEFPIVGSELLGVLSDEHRLKILQELERGPGYQKELSESTGIKGGQWKHHIDLLKDAGFIAQETVRGRYLVTQLGREALKLAEIVFVRKRYFERKPVEDEPFPHEDEVHDRGPEPVVKIQLEDDEEEETKH